MVLFPPPLWRVALRGGPLRRRRPSPALSRPWVLQGPQVRPRRVHGAANLPAVPSSPYRCSSPLLCAPLLIACPRAHSWPASPHAPSSLCPPRLRPPRCLLNPGLIVPLQSSLLPTPLLLCASCPHCSPNPGLVVSLISPCDPFIHPLSSVPPSLLTARLPPLLSTPRAHCQPVVPRLRRGVGYSHCSRQAAASIRDHIGGFRRGRISLRDILIGCPSAGSGGRHGGGGTAACVRLAGPACVRVALFCGRGGALGCGAGWRGRRRRAACGGAGR